VAVEPLVVVPGSPWFVGARTGRAVLLTGSHTWNNFQDLDLHDPPRSFDYDTYLDFLERHGHDLIRLYVWEQAAGFAGMHETVTIVPLPWARTGPGVALDGEPRFDLDRFDPAYFARLRDRVDRAAARGIYVSVMLFDGWSVEAKGQPVGNPWLGHPFNRANNVNGVDGDTNGDGEGTEVHSLENPRVTELQRQYLAQVVRTLWGAENVLFEISNESAHTSVEWQYEMIRSIRALEAAAPVKHPIGMTATFPEDIRGNTPLLDSPADWISPHVEPWEADEAPRVATDKIVFEDTDHVFGVGGTVRWVWTRFARGENVLFMDPCTTAIDAKLLPTWRAGDSAPALPAPCPGAQWEPVRTALGQARALAQRLELGALTPHPELSSTSACLANPGREYLVFAPLTHRRLGPWLGLLSVRLGAPLFSVDVSAAQGPLAAEWVNTRTGELVPGQAIAGGARVELRAPFVADAVLHLRAASPR